ncbi:hypothetical protein GOP47_0018919 [Adiantum capillus-veneris]|uniref:HTH cro/C1-type domain-containing protein n=1 Tax=Adiantum capillus-veneris TaxID=13818 RepID=A0A9D4ZA39_ADICA|nr:hypothetical protein GOP47_0018919 [Adiantum capillus-veneris]
MGGSERRESSAYSRLLHDSAASIAETLTLFAEPAPAGVTKVEWKEAITAAEGVVRHATTAGVLWKGKVSKKEGMENIRSYVQALHGFLLLSHGSTAGAGPTLLSCIGRLSRQVVNSSLSLLRGAVAGFSNSVQDTDLAVLVGCVWEACEAVKKAPVSNRVAIGRSLTQVAISVKDVIREVGEFECGTLDCNSETVKEDTTELCSSDQEGVSEAEGEAEASDESTELSNRLSAEEMQVVESVKAFGSSLFSLIKQLLHIVAGTGNASKEVQMADAKATPILEKILELSKALGVAVDELGASLYPPQEIDILQGTVTEIEGLIEHLQTEVNSLIGLMPEDFLVALNACKDAAGSLNKILEAARTP